MPAAAGGGRSAHQKWISYLRRTRPNAAEVLHEKGVRARGIRSARQKRVRELQRKLDVVVRGTGDVPASSVWVSKEHKTSFGTYYRAYDPEYFKFLQARARTKRGVHAEALGRQAGRLLQEGEAQTERLQRALEEARQSGRLFSWPEFFRQDRDIKQRLLKGTWLMGKMYGLLPTFRLKPSEEPIRSKATEELVKLRLSVLSAETDLKRAESLVLVMTKIHELGELGVEGKFSSGRRRQMWSLYTQARSIIFRRLSEMEGGQLPALPYERAKLQEFMEHSAAQLELYRGEA